MRRTLSSVIVAALALFGLGGCKQDAPLAFKRRPKLYHSIVSLSPSTTEIMLQVLVMPNLAGRTAADDFPPAMVKNIPIVADLKPDYEKLVAAHPDLIVYDAALYNDEDIKKLKSLGVDMYAIDADKLDGYEKELYDLGELVGGETHISDYIDRLNVNLATAKGKPPQPAPKVAVIMPSVTGDDYIAGTDSFVDGVVKEVGGVPVGPTGKLFVKLSPETLVAANPDVIIVSATKEDSKGAIAFSQDPRFQTVAAVKNKKIKPIETGVLLRRGSRVDRLVDVAYRSIMGS